MKSIYLDYNATSPLADSVKEYLAKGDFSFANPASTHSSGKKAATQINSIKADIKQQFGMVHSHLIFHSGVTEAANTFFKRDEKIHMFHFNSDHPCILEVAKYLKKNGHEVTAFDLNQNGLFNQEEIIKEIKKAQKPAFLNFTWVHNETGIVWDLARAQEIKKQTGCFIHVDAAQVVGKIENYVKLNPNLDFYSFSGHKFGALKGIGFSFVNPDFPFKTYLHGGGQQKAMRSGTESLISYESIRLALDEVSKFFNPELSLKNKIQIELALEDLLRKNVTIVGKNAQRNLNTINFLHHKERADVLLTALDLAGIEASSGSACSSGSVLESATIKSMGFKELAAHSIRLSLPLNSSQISTSEIINRLKKALSNFQ